MLVADRLARVGDFRPYGTPAFMGLDYGILNDEHEGRIQSAERAVPTHHKQKLKVTNLLSA